MGRGASMMDQPSAKGFSAILGRGRRGSRPAPPPPVYDVRAWQAIEAIEDADWHGILGRFFPDTKLLQAIYVVCWQLYQERGVFYPSDIERYFNDDIEGADHAQIMLDGLTQRGFMGCEYIWDDEPPSYYLLHKIPETATRPTPDADEDYFYPHAYPDFWAKTE
jgi:hypothetical protein